MRLRSYGYWRLSLVYCTCNKHNHIDSNDDEKEKENCYYDINYLIISFLVNNETKLTFNLPVGRRDNIYILYNYNKNCQYVIDTKENVIVYL